MLKIYKFSECKIRPPSPSSLNVSDTHANKRRAGQKKCILAEEKRSKVGLSPVCFQLITFTRTFPKSQPPIPPAPVNLRQKIRTPFVLAFLIHFLWQNFNKSEKRIAPRPAVNGNCIASPPWSSSRPGSESGSHIAAIPSGLDIWLN